LTICPFDLIFKPKPKERTMTGKFLDQPVSSGLENVVAADTVLSEVDGARGRLVIRGLPVEALARQETFEGVARLLFEGFFEDLPAPPLFARALGAARTDVFAETAALDARLLTLEPIEAMRALIARLPDGDGLNTALALLAAPAVFLPAILRAQQGLHPVAPDPSRGHAEDILRMLTKDEPGPGLADALDAYMVTVSDHGLNASTFAARVVASTWSGLTSSVLAGIGALKGPLHGGAPGPVIEMLDGIGAAENARAWIEAALDRGDRLMGFGHRVYRVRDPRANALKEAVKRLAESSNELPGRLALAEAVEKAAIEILQRRKPDRPLDVNVELYTALLLEALRFPPAAFTPVFAAARTAGWIAHAREQRLNGRLIRPQSRYVGPEPLAA
jgi:citrate synthase